MHPDVTVRSGTAQTGRNTLDGVQLPWFPSYTEHPTLVDSDVRYCPHQTHSYPDHVLPVIGPG